MAAGRSIRQFFALDDVCIPVGIAQTNITVEKRELLTKIYGWILLGCFLASFHIFNMNSELVGLD